MSSNTKKSFSLQFFWRCLLIVVSRDDWFVRTINFHCGLKCKFDWYFCPQPISSRIVVSIVGKVIECCIISVCFRDYKSSGWWGQYGNLRPLMIFHRVHLICIRLSLPLAFACDYFDHVFFFFFILPIMCKFQNCSCIVIYKCFSQRQRSAYLFRRDVMVMQMRWSCRWLRNVVNWFLSRIVDSEWKLM